MKFLGVTHQIICVSLGFFAGPAVAQQNQQPNACDQQQQQPGTLAQQGAGIGGALGTLGGMFARGNRVTNGIVGGAVGSAAGGIAGQGLQSEQDRAAASERALQCQTQQAKADADAQRQAADEADRETQSYAISFKAMQARLAAGRRLTATQTSTLQRARSDRDRMEQAVISGRKKVQEIDQQVVVMSKAGHDTSKLQAEAKDLDESTSHLEESLDTMKSALASMNS